MEAGGFVGGVDAAGGGVLGFIGVDEGVEFGAVEGEIGLGEGRYALFVDGLEEGAAGGVDVAAFVGFYFEEVKAGSVDLFGDAAFGGKGEAGAFCGGDAAADFAEFPEGAA